MNTQSSQARVIQLRDEIAVRCASSRAGRVLLHLVCAIGDHQVIWHFRGIAREFGAPSAQFH